MSQSIVVPLKTALEMKGWKFNSPSGSLPKTIKQKSNCCNQPLRNPDGSRFTPEQYKAHRAAVHHQWYLNHLEEHKARSLAWHHAHRDEKNAYNRAAAKGRRIKRLFALLDRLVES
jgi:hypothetical protein